jgi:serine/threonine-protein kinase
VVERVARGGVYGDQEIADWVRDARRLATLEHPNVARIRDVVIRGEEVFVVGEFVDGVRWSELVGGPQKVSLEIALRVMVDVLSGLSAVHNLRDAKREPLKLVHGELTPDCVVVGLDGVARVVSTCRVRSATARPGRDGSAYLAPEVLLADETADARADVYSAGVMLWEALSGRPLFPNTQPSAIVTHLLSGKVLRATVPDGSPWAAPLADVASRALSADPEKRFTSAAALAADVRRIAGPKLAPPVRVAAYIRATFGDRVQARRAELERGEVRARAVSVSGVLEPAPASEDIPVDISPSTISTAPTPIPPPFDQAPAKAPGRPPPVARVAPKPPALPDLRPRLPTLAGVAPPASLPEPAEGQGTPVVVPPSPPPRAVIAPPTPMVAFELPSAARPSTDLRAAIPASPLADLFPVAPAPPVVLPVPAASPPTPAAPFVASLDEPLAPQKPRRGLLVALLAGPILFGMALMVWWLLARSPPHAATLPAPPALQPTLSAAAIAPPSTPDTPTATTATTTAASADTTVAAEVAPTVVTPSLEPAPVPTASPSATTTASAATTPPPVNATPPWTPPTAYTPPPAVRPNKRKYEPEGI